MIATQHNNDIITTTTRDTSMKKLLRWEEIWFQDLFQTVSNRRVTNVTWNSVPYGRPYDSKSFIPILVSGRWYEEKGVVKCTERVTGPCGGLETSWSNFQSDSEILWSMTIKWFVNIGPTDIVWKKMCSRTGSQCNENASSAALFWIDWSRLSSFDVVP